MSSHYDSSERRVLFGLFALIIACIVGLVMACLSFERESRHCAARGGQMVPYGAPYYVKTGNLMVPVQSTRCEVP